MDVRMLKIIGSGNCVVDLGCGSGEILRDLANQFHLRIGLDASKRRLVEIGGGRTDGWVFREVDLNEEFPLMDSSTDVVVANQVIEHIINPIKFVKEIYRILRPRGRCVITPPNICYLKNLVHLLFSGYGPRTAGGNIMDGEWDDGHLHYFTHKDLMGLFKKAGFSIISTKGFINLQKNSWMRRIADAYSAKLPVREFLSGNILLVAKK